MSSHADQADLHRILSRDKAFARTNAVAYSCVTPDPTYFDGVGACFGLSKMSDPIYPQGVVVSEDEGTTQPDETTPRGYRANQLGRNTSGDLQYNSQTRSALDPTPKDTYMSSAEFQEFQHQRSTNSRRSNIRKEFYEALSTSYRVLFRDPVYLQPKDLANTDIRKAQSSIYTYPSTTPLSREPSPSTTTGHHDGADDPFIHHDYTSHPSPSCPTPSQSSSATDENEGYPDGKGPSEPYPYSEYDSYKSHGNDDRWADWHVSTEESHEELVGASAVYGNTADGSEFY